MNNCFVYKINIFYLSCCNTCPIAYRTLVNDGYEVVKLYKYDCHEQGAVYQNRQQTASFR